MNIGEESEEERTDPLIEVDPEVIEVEENPAEIPVFVPEEAPIAVPFWPTPVKVPMIGG